VSMRPVQNKPELSRKAAKAALAAALNPDPDSILDYFLEMAAGDRARIRENRIKAAEASVAARKRRAKKAGEERWRQQRAEKAEHWRRTRKPAFGRSQIQRILAAMSPGGWYTRDDLVKMIGAGRGARAKCEAMREYGLLKRALDPKPP